MKHRVSDIIDAAAELTGVSYGEMIGTCRARHISNVRAAVVMIAREYGFSYPHIGGVMRKDHSSMVHYVKNFPMFVARSPTLLVLVDDLRDVVENGRITRRNAICRQPIAFAPPPVIAKPALRPIIDLNDSNRDAGHWFHRGVKRGSARLLAAINVARAAA